MLKQGSWSLRKAKNIDRSGLEQNIPNPFNHSTAINYTLPQTYTSAKIIITTRNGSVLKEINLSGSGKGNVTVDASTLSAGAYQYAFYIDGNLVDAKQMIVVK